jgi:hypothetical protein
MSAIRQTMDPGHVWGKRREEEAKGGGKGERGGWQEMIAPRKAEDQNTREER